MNLKRALLYNKGIFAEVEDNVKSEIFAINLVKKC